MNTHTRVERIEDKQYQEVTLLDPHSSDSAFGDRTYYRRLAPNEWQVKLEDDSWEDIHPPHRGSGVSQVRQEALEQMYQTEVTRRKYED